jgi:hypothetical protein
MTTESVFTRIRSTYPLFEWVAPDDGGYWSILLPTMRLGFASYGQFYAPSSPIGNVGRSVAWRFWDQNGAPVGAFKYGLALRFGVAPAFERHVEGSIADIRAARRSCDLLIEGSSALFFDSRTDSQRTEELRAILKLGFSTSEIGAWRSVFPDFFDWLEK